jgi:hypothetical protein
MVDYDRILNTPAFQVLEPQRREAFRQLLQRIDGKSTMEVMGSVLAFSKNLPKGRDISKEEQSAMTQVLYDSMDDTDKQKFAAVMKMAELMNRQNK